MTTALPYQGGPLLYYGTDHGSWGQGDMQSYWGINLIFPSPSANDLTITTAGGTWEISKKADYLNVIAEIERHMCGETCLIESGSTDNFDDLTPLLIGLSYLLGHTVTVERSTPASTPTIVQPSDHWPRARGLGLGYPVVQDNVTLERKVAIFVNNWVSHGKPEKALLLVHHWLDCLACWSLEDLYLSATTLLQIISATEATRQSKKLNFYKGVSDASTRFGITALVQDFKDMRNDLIHYGSLSGNNFHNKDRFGCCQVAADVMNWIDAYIHASMNLGSPTVKRFTKGLLLQLNSFSLD